MGFSFRRSFSLGRFLRLNLSRSGPSLSFRAGRFSANTRGTGNVRIAKGFGYRFGRRRRR